MITLLTNGVIHMWMSIYKAGRRDVLDRVSMFEMRTEYQDADGIEACRQSKRDLASLVMSLLPAYPEGLEVIAEDGFKWSRWTETDGRFSVFIDHSSRPAIWRLPGRPRRAEAANGQRWTIYADTADVAEIRSIGGGNLSKGIRMLLDAHKASRAASDTKPCDPP